MEGTMVLTKLRKQGINIPIILITALGTLNDKVTGLNLGADDYLVKPFAFEELLARIQCVTRRSPIINQAILPSYCDIRFDGTSNTLTGPAGSCTCSKREGAMLETFIKNGADFSAPKFYRQYIISSLTISSALARILFILRKIQTSKKSKLLLITSMNAVF